jgi:hypothetical protein
VATVKTSIGKGGTLGSSTPSSCSGSSSPYDVTFPSTPTGSTVGDLVTISDDATYYSTFTYLITAIDTSGSNPVVTLKYLSDNGSNGDTSPCSLQTMDYETYSYEQAAGSFKRAYSTITAWEADLDSSSIYNLNDIASGEIHADNSTAFNESVTINGGSSLDGVILTVHEDSRHNGTAYPATGDNQVTVKYTGSNTSTIQVSRNDVTIEWIEFDMSSGANANNRAMTVNSTAYENIHIRRNIVHNLIGSFPIAFRIEAGNSSSDSRYLTNNIVFDINDSDDRVKAFLTLSQYATYFYNNTTYLIRTGRSDKDAYSYFNNTYSAMIVKNCLGIMTSSTGSEYFLGNAGTADYNATDLSSAGGGSNDLTSLSTSVFVSVTSGAEDLHLASGSDPIGEGVDLGTVGGVNIDIDGRDRDATGDIWDIGADQTAPTIIYNTPTAIDVSVVTSDPSGSLDGFSASPVASSMSLVSSDPSGSLDGFSASPVASDLSVVTSDPSGSLGSFSASPVASDLSIVTSDPSGSLGSFSASPVSSGLSIVTSDPSGSLDGFSASPVASDLSIVTSDPSGSLGSFTASPVASSMSVMTVDPTTDLSGDTSSSPDAIAITVATADPVSVIRQIPEAIDLSIVTSNPSGSLGSFTVSPTPLAMSLVSSDPSGSLGSFSASPVASSMSLVSSDPSGSLDGFSASPVASSMSLVSSDPTTLHRIFNTPTTIEMSVVTTDPDDLFSSFSASPDPSLFKLQTTLGRGHLFGVLYIDAPFISLARVESPKISSSSIDSTIYVATISDPSMENK